MKWVARLAVRLYPRWWRRRYGTEVDVLVEDLGVSWMAVIDLVTGAVSMQLRTVGVLPLLGALAGAAVGALVVMWTPAEYQSTATLRLSMGGDFGDSEAGRALLARISSAIPSEETRRATSISVSEFNGDRTTMSVAHFSSDARTAHDVVTRVVSVVTDGEGGLGTVVVPPSMPSDPLRPNRAVQLSLGAIGGLLLGIGAMWMRRRAGPA